MQTRLILAAFVLLLGVGLIGAFHSGTARADDDEAAPAGAASPAADDESPKQKPKSDEKSLDDELFKSLNDEADETGEKKTSRDEPAADDLDDELMKGLGDGEDVGEKPDPLAEITRRMRKVEERIRAQKPDETTQEMQEKIAADLQKLVDELVKKACECQKSGQSGEKSKSSASAKRQLVKTPGAKKPSKGANQKESPARESSDQLREHQLEKIQKAEVADRMKRVWGHLPERLREQMQENADEEFLPLYQQLIGEYFQSLIDESEPRD